MTGQAGDTDMGLFDPVHTIESDRLRKLEQACPECRGAPRTLGFDHAEGGFACSIFAELEPGGGDPRCVTVIHLRRDGKARIPGSSAGR